LAGDQIVVTSRIIRRIIAHATATCGYDPQAAGKELNLRVLDAVVQWDDAVRARRGGKGRSRVPMTEHNAFLRAIAASPDENAPRLVFADWLEEQGEPDRAEFIRTQCALTLPGLPERRHALRVRERDLLDAHRQEWCQAFGLPIEDIVFERGLIASVRLSEWDRGRVLDPECAAQLATLRELDLSGLQLGDADLAAFAATAQMPALRKLILSDNDITGSGAVALAKAAGLPRLETLYLFGNPIGDVTRATLERSKSFRLGNLDVGEPAEGYCMSPGEAEMARRQYLRTHLLPVVSRYFTTYERLRSAMLCVAQYWADEANDAVHAELIVSELFEPTLEGVSWEVSWDEDGPHADPNLPNTYIKRQYGKGSSSNVWLSATEWDDNNGAIPLWAAFAPEGGSQEYEALSEAYAPAVMFYRHGGYEILPMLRPQLDGVETEWGTEPETT
jgi:uncharacterized protein (TIGR02996 family)